MIDRYTPADFSILWSEKHKFKIWLEIELNACEVMELHGKVPKGVTQTIRQKKLEIKPERIEEIERDTKHDVSAFLTHVEELVGPHAKWLHLGMTSSDVLDTASAMIIKDAIELLLIRCARFLKTLERRIREHEKTPMMGRSHGISAVTFGLVLAGHYSEIVRGYSRLIRAKKEISVGKISGAVGTYAHLSPKIEEEILKKLSLIPEIVSTQIVARDRYAELFAAMALIAAGIERLATNIRLLQRSEVGEVEEAFSEKQKGSSAMPHKRNPILSENLCGLSRVVRSALTPAIENISLWHERDISHSSVERILIPDTTSTLGCMLDRARTLIENLVVYPKNMQKNLDEARELYFSESILLFLVGKGMPRQYAYTLVQKNAMKAWRKEGKFRDFLRDDVEIKTKINEKEINEIFNLEHALQHVPEIINRALSRNYDPSHFSAG